MAQSKTTGLQQRDTSYFTIDNCVNEFSLDRIEKTKAGYQYWFADKKFIDGRTVKLSVVAPHQATHAPHRHAEDEFFFVLEGKAEFILRGMTKIVGPMTSLYCPPNIEHGIRNTGDTELKYLVIKKYEQAAP
jgi:quercetin dioxygenase-like cupin family protein